MSKAEILAARALELSNEHQLGYLIQYSRCLLGHAWSSLRRTSDGIKLLRDGISGSIDSGLRLRLGYFTAVIARALMRNGDLHGALERIEAALNTNPEELFYRPELFNVRGEIHLGLNQISLAESDFREAVSMARKMSAKAWELRSSLSLARLLSSQARRGEARTMLAEIYGWFTEGFDTADLKDAKALLDELSA
jgi:tetratricopeptide (TPR) repeat protein